MAIATPTVSQFTPISTGAADQITPTTVDQSKLTTPVATTVQDQLTGILNKGGALMQQAATTGNQQAASRGLLNSSMGIQASQAAVLGQAVPIATQDASNLNQMAVQNANTLNQNLQSNANILNTAEQANVSANNQFAQFNAQNANAAAQWNAAQKNEALLKTLDINSREQLANIEADYKQIMQVNASAGTMYEQAMKNINDIQTNKDIADKQTAINSQLAWLRSGMQMIQNLNGVSGLLTF